MDAKKDDVVGEMKRVYDVLLENIAILDDFSKEEVEELGKRLESDFFTLL